MKKIVDKWYLTWFEGSSKGREVEGMEPKTGIEPVTY
jgi:hypothetical protein